METIEIKLELTEHHVKDPKDDFTSELAQAWVEYELDMKESELEEYLEAYDAIKDKDSFNAQYLETLIENLKTELNK